MYLVPVEAQFFCWMNKLINKRQTWIQILTLRKWERYPISPSIHSFGRQGGQSYPLAGSCEGKLAEAKSVQPSPGTVPPPPIRMKPQRPRWTSEACEQRSSLLLSLLSVLSLIISAVAQLFSDVFQAAEMRWERRLIVLEKYVEESDFSLQRFFCIWAKLFEVAQKGRKGK